MTLKKAQKIYLIILLVLLAVAATLALTDVPYQMLSGLIGRPGATSERIRGEFHKEFDKIDPGYAKPQ